MSEMIRKATLAAAVTIATTGGALAATATDDLGVSLTVEASCTVVATDLAFGATATLAADIDEETTLSVTCSDGTAYAVGLGPGASSGATDSTRAMTKVSDTETVTYSLFSDSGRTTNFGSSGTADVDGTGDGSAQTITVYGRVDGGQTAPTGSYADTVTVTVTYTP